VASIEPVRLINADRKKLMRAEIVNLVDEMKQSIGLLRRHL
jgi:hypothetical protein